MFSLRAVCSQCEIRVGAFYAAVIDDKGAGQGRTGPEGVGKSILTFGGSPSYQACGEGREQIKSNINE